MRRRQTILGQGECVARRCLPTELYGRTSENSVWAKFAEYPSGEVGLMVLDEARV